jgi:hypothetical protein
MLAIFSTPVTVTRTSFVTSERTTTATYTSTVLDTTLVSTTAYTVVQRPLNISPQGVGFMAPKGKCGQDTIPLTVKSGTTLNLELTSTNPANLYIIPSDTYQTSSNGCDLTGSSLLLANNFTDYTLHWTATGDGTVYLLLTGPNTIIILRDLGSSESVQEFATYTRTDTSLSFHSSTNIANYTTTTVRSDTSNPVIQIPFELSFVALILSVLASALLLGPGKRFPVVVFLKQSTSKTLVTRWTSRNHRHQIGLDHS